MGRAEHSAYANAIAEALRGAASSYGRAVALPDWTEIQQHRFVQVAGVEAPPNGRESNQPERPNSVGKDQILLSALGGSTQASAGPLLFVFSSAGAESIRVHIGVPPSSPLTPEAALGLARGAHRGLIGTAEDDRLQLGGKVLGELMGTTSWVRLEGVPRRVDPVEQDATVDRIARGMGANPWVMVVEAWPLPLNLLRRAQHDCEQCATDLRAVESEQRTIGSISTTVANASVTAALELVEQYRKLLGEAMLEGGWIVRTHVGSSNPVLAGAAAALAAGGLSGDRESVRPLNRATCTAGVASQPAPSPVFPTSIGSGTASVMDVPWTSARLATAVALPRAEYQGFERLRGAEFDVSLPSYDDSIVGIGPTVRHTAQPRTVAGQRPLLSLRKKDLVRHVLVTGVTGSGKTMTMVRVLQHVAREGVPFMVVEPAKAEYARLLGKVGPVTRYSLGDGSGSLRLNPLEAPRGIRIQTHVDHVRSLFNASFVMYSPMPQVLEQALYECYTQLGWDLASNTNSRLVDHDNEDDASRRLIFPTLRDLSEQIELVVERLGYDKEITMNVKAGLKTRIDSLRVGAKAALLDGPSNTTMDELLAENAILELELIGDDEEKCFIMGLIFLSLYEHRVAEDRRRGATGTEADLRHFLVIEEAHRLLRATASADDPESANGRGKAVENFCNMLAEIRAYGQGFGICEQIPSKLAQDAIKNTNVKVVHRMLAKDDRSALAHCMCMSDEQSDALPALPPGRAAVFAEGMDGPALIDVIKSDSQGAAPSRAARQAPAVPAPDTALLREVATWLAEELLFPEGKAPERLTRLLETGTSPLAIRAAICAAISKWCRAYALDARLESRLLADVESASLSQSAAPKSVALALTRMLSESAADIYEALRSQNRQHPKDLCQHVCPGPCMVLPLAESLGAGIDRSLRVLVAAGGDEHLQDAVRIAEEELLVKLGHMSLDLSERLVLCRILDATWQKNLDRDLAENRVDYARACMQATDD